MSKKKTASQKVLWPAIGILILLGIVWLAVTAPKRPASSITTREVALTCTTDMATKFHIHPHLTITIDGTPQDIPSGIGIKPQCMNSLHTHATGGEIHVESPEKRDFTLSDFFAVWGKPFDSTQVLDQKITFNDVIKVTVNGKEVDTFEKTILYDKDDIVIAFVHRL